MFGQKPPNSRKNRPSPLVRFSPSRDFCHPEAGPRRKAHLVERLQTTPTESAARDGPASDGFSTAVFPNPNLTGVPEESEDSDGLCEGPETQAQNSQARRGIRLPRPSGERFCRRPTAERFCRGQSPPLRSVAQGPSPVVYPRPLSAVARRLVGKERHHRSAQGL